LRTFLLIFLPWLALLLQTTILDYLSISGVVPDLVLIFVVFFALLNKVYPGTIYGFCCGLLEDLYLGRFIGINAISKGLTAFIIGKLQGNVFKDNLFVGIMSVFIATLLNSAFVFILSIASYDFFHFDISLLIGLIIQVLFNTTIALPLYVWYHGFSRKELSESFGEL
jgi:rod shape-determining protein MreD